MSIVDTITQINKEVARKLNLDEDLVKKVNRFYWSEGVKKTISSGKHTSINLTGIGTIVVSRSKLYRRIKKLIGLIRWYRNNPDREFPRKTRLERLKDLTDELSLMLARRNEVAIMYKCNSDRFKEKYANKRRLAEQALDNARDSEQTIDPSSDTGPG